MQYSYIDGDEHVFMDLESYEEARVASADIAAAEFIKDDMWRQPSTRQQRCPTAHAGVPPSSRQLQIKYWKGVPIDVMVPATGSYMVSLP